MSGLTSLASGWECFQKSRKCWSSWAGVFTERDSGKNVDSSVKLEHGERACHVFQRVVWMGPAALRTGLAQVAGNEAVFSQMQYDSVPVSVGQRTNAEANVKAMFKAKSGICVFA